MNNKPAHGCRQSQYPPCLHAYSNYSVGAAVLTSDDQIFSGINIENAAYPAGTCAERVALGNAISQGHTNSKAIAVFFPQR